MYSFLLLLMFTTSTQLQISGSDIFTEDSDWNLKADALEEYGYGSEQIKNESIPHQRYPKINPINPNLVAYEYGEKIRIVNKSSSNFPDFPLFEIECGSMQAVQATQSVSIFETTGDLGVIEPQRNDFDCAYFDWRPILDSRGNYWFSFTSSVSNTLYLGFINPTLQCYQVDETTDKLVIKGCEYDVLIRADNNTITRPKWSPDGQFLLYNDGNGLYMTMGLHDHIRRKDFSDLEISLLTRDAYYPEWSPNGRYIIYEFNTSLAANVVGDISADSVLVNLHIMDLKSPGTNSVFLSLPIDNYLVQSSVNERVKPKWSQSGRYLSYLIPSVFEDRWDLKVTEVVLDETMDQILRLESVSGRQSRAYVTDVFRGSELRSGYPITTLSDGNTEEEILIYIKRDQENQNPIHVVPISRDAARVGIQRRTIIFNDSVLNDNIDAFFDGNVTHLTYSSQEGSAMRLQKKYMNREFGEIHERMVPIPISYDLPRELSSRASTYRSVILPGLGQMYKGETGKGFVYLSTFAAATAGLVMIANKNRTDFAKFNEINIEFDNNLVETNTLEGIEKYYQKRNADYRDLLELKEDISLNNTLIITAGVVMVGVYFYSIYDSRRGFPVIRTRDGSRTRLSVQPEIYEGNLFRPANAGIQLRFRVD